LVKAEGLRDPGICSSRMRHTGLVAGLRNLAAMRRRTAAERRKSTMKCEICIDVDDVNRAVRFYGEGIGLTVIRQEPDWAELKIGEQTIWIMKVAAGKSGAISRDYRRHWTPVHLDLRVEDLDKTIERAVAAGGKLEARPRSNLANLSDPSGNGVDLVQASGK